MVEVVDNAVEVPITDLVAFFVFTVFILTGVPVFDVPVFDGPIVELAGAVLVFAAVVFTLVVLAAGLLLAGFVPGFEVLAAGAPQPMNPSVSAAISDARIMFIFISMFTCP